MVTKTILLDVGGTFVKCSDGREIPIDSAGSREAIVASLKAAVGDAESVSVAIPGPFDYVHGVFLMKHKFQAVYGERFADLVVSDKVRQAPTFRFIHDVNCMLLGEIRSGAGVGFERVAIVSLGTGLGFAMSIDGHILTNEAGSPKVPIWNLPYMDGILEDYASKRGVVYGFGDASLTVKEIAAQADSGDEKARKVFEKMGRILGEAIAPVLEEYRIQLLLLGGQISRSSHLFAPSMTSHLPAGISVQPISDFDNATFNGLKEL